VTPEDLTAENTSTQDLTPEEWANNLSEPALYAGELPERSREQEVTGPSGELMGRFREIMMQTGDLEWLEKTLAGLSHKPLWRDDATGGSISLVRFVKGSGIPSRHSHASNQFMFCLTGKYTYLPTGITLVPGSFYWNPKGSLHGPTHADEDTVMIEIYDGPHYPTQPEWYSDPSDAH
jgi:quercetin dioxygenase-like cupin family protein